MALLGMERTGRAPSTLLLLGAPRPAQNEHHQLELNPGTLDECSIRIPIFEGAEIEKGVAKRLGTNTQKNRSLFSNVAKIRYNDRR